MMDWITKKDVLDYLASRGDEDVIHEKGTYYMNIISLSYKRKYGRLLAVSDKYDEEIGDDLFVCKGALKEWEKQLLKECDLLVPSGLMYLKKYLAVDMLNSIGF